MLRFEPAVDIYTIHLELNTTPSQTANTVSHETKHPSCPSLKPRNLPPQTPWGKSVDSSGFWHGPALESSSLRVQVSPNRNRHKGWPV